MNGEHNGGSRKGRVGLMSCINYPGDDFRQALLPRSKEIFAREDVQFIVLAGGLVSDSAIKAKRKELKAKIKEIKAQIDQMTKEAKKRRQERIERVSNCEKNLRSSNDKLVKAEAELESLGEDAAERRTKLESVIAKAKGDVARLSKRGKYEHTRNDNLTSADAGEIAELEDALKELFDQLDQLEPANIAAQLAQILPLYTDASGNRVNLYIVPSPILDGVEGMETFHLLKQMRDDIRLYNPGHDRFFLRPPDKWMEVLTLEVAEWASDNHSAPADRILKNRIENSQDPEPDLYAIGGVGVSLLKPSGMRPRPSITVPQLSCLNNAKAPRNQIGVSVISVHPDYTCPMSRNFSLKDDVSNELQFIGMPNPATETRRVLVEELKRRKTATAGMLADLTGMSEKDINAELHGMIISGGRPRKTWPGVIYDEQSRRWMFDKNWIQRHLLYPPLPKVEALNVDSIVAFSCLHAGAVTGDYRFFLKMVPRIVMERRASVLVNAGDVIQGLKHNLDRRGEIYRAIGNITEQEEFAARLIAKVNMTVFRIRFAEALERLRSAGKPISEDQIRMTVLESLLTNVICIGNHDEWSIEDGVTPLAHMENEYCIRMVEAIERELRKSGLVAMGMHELVQSRLLYPTDGRRSAPGLLMGSYVLPSGIRLSVMHPRMSNTKTTTMRAQQMLEMAADSHVVIGGNFHAAVQMNRYNASLGQRTAMQLGTLMHKTAFENGKLKRVDQGFGNLKIWSQNQRILATEATFFENNPANYTPLNNRQGLENLYRDLGLDDI